MIQDLWKKAGSLRDRASTAVSAYHRLDQAVRTEPAWAWANGVELNNLSARKVDVDSFARQSQFWKDFFLLDLAAMKKKYEEKVSSKELLALEECTKFMEALERQVTKMTSMHSAFLLHQ